MSVYKPQMTIITGCALDEDKYYVSVINDEIDFEIECCQMVLYDFKSDSWQEHHNNMDWRAESIAVQHVAHQWTFFAINSEGMIEAYSNGHVQYDEIKDAGIHKSNVFYGSINRIRSIENQLFVCGSRGQIYRKTDDQWLHFDHGLLMQQYDITNVDKALLLDLDHQASLLDIYDINMLNGEFYACGAHNQGGFIATYFDDTWKKILNVDDGLLSMTRCPNGKDLIVCGDYGELYKGNAHDGFEKIILNGLTFYESAFYQHDLYFASTRGVFIYQENADFKRVEDIPEVEINHIEQKGDVLWAVSFKHIFRFDGEKWAQIKHPFNDQ